MSVPDKQIRKLDLKMSKYPPNICKNMMIYLSLALTGKGWRASLY